MQITNTNTGDTLSICTFIFHLLCHNILIRVQYMSPFSLWIYIEIQIQIRYASTNQMQTVDMHFHLSSALIQHSYQSPIHVSIFIVSYQVEIYYKLKSKARKIQIIDQSEVQFAISKNHKYNYECKFR